MLIELVSMIVVADILPTAIALKLEMDIPLAANDVEEAVATESEPPWTVFKGWVVSR